MTSILLFLEVMVSENQLLLYAFYRHGIAITWSGFLYQVFQIPDRKNRFIGEYGSNINEVFNENYYMKYNERQYTLNYADCNVKDTTGKVNRFKF